MTSITISEAIDHVVQACNREEALLNYLWAVMEEMDDGMAVGDVVQTVFAGDADDYHQARDRIEAAWVDGGGRAFAPNLIAQTQAARLVMIRPAWDAVYESLNTD